MRARDPEIAFIERQVAQSIEHLRQPAPVADGAPTLQTPLHSLSIARAAWGRRATLPSPAIPRAA